MITCNISKDQFVKYINNLQNFHALTYELDSVVRKYNIDYLNLPDNSSLAVSILDDIFSPICRDISYFCWELDFGKNYTEGDVKDSDNHIIDFSSAESLYDYLISDKNKKYNNIC